MKTLSTKEAAFRMPPMRSFKPRCPKAPGLGLCVRRDAAAASKNYGNYAGSCVSLHIVQPSHPSATPYKPKSGLESQ
ncbi:hypothetical protein EJ08DRAFT_651163 [Tothia fuscella]|uniref:Uncharacterized protein n=1 Tax=Tothia fuscella TaxID=1048955 RepID=A0A9P4NNG7_9PEZI|nr:hypothetical protein EJ08DRAFT_651163 [Tothia fuscella]